MASAVKLDMKRVRLRLRNVATRIGLLRFWRWWTSELAPLLPDAWRTALQRRFARPVIEFTGSEAVVWCPEFSQSATRLAIVERVSLIGDAAAVLAAGRAAVARLKARGSGGIAAPRVAVALGPRQLLRKELSLPAAVEENLAQTLAYDLDRHTPFRPDQLYFDSIVLGRDAGKKTIAVDLAAALKSVVDGARKQVEEWGAIPVSIIPGPPEANGTRLNLIPGAARATPLQWRRWQVWAPLAALAAIALATIAVPLLQKREYAIALGAAVAQAGQQAHLADGVRQQLDSTQNDYNYILAKKYAYPSIVHVLDEVTRVLPDDTWLTQFELKTTGHGKENQRDVYLRGEAENAGKLIALLEDSKLVDQAAPRSPTTKIQGMNGEVFDLGARLVAQAPPAPVALVPGEAPAATPAPVRPPPALGAAPRKTPPTAAAAPVSRARCGPRAGRRRAGAARVRRSPAHARGGAAGEPVCLRRRARGAGRLGPGGTAVGRAELMATLALPLPPRQSRALAIALLLLVVMLGLAVLVVPVLLFHRHYDLAIADRQDQLQRYRRVAAEMPELKKALEALRAKDGRRFFLHNTAPNLAGAELQDMVRAAIENNGGRITTIQSDQPRDDGRFRQIGINVQLFATTPNLQKILFALETHTPYTLIDNLTIRPLNGFRGFKPPPGIDPELSVQLEVSAFTAAEAEKK